MLSNDPNGAEKLKHYTELVEYVRQLTDANKAIVNTLNATQDQLTKMFKADTSNDEDYHAPEWYKAYFNLQILAQYEGRTVIFNPDTGELPMEIIE